MKQDRVLLALALSVLSAFYAFTLSLPITQLDRFAPDDAFFYLRISQNWLRGYGITFDTISPATGFHLGWFLLLSAWLEAVSTVAPRILNSPFAMLWWSIALELLLALVSSMALWCILRNRLGLPVGVVFLGVLLVGLEFAGYGMLMETQFLLLVVLLLLRFQLGLDVEGVYLLSSDIGSSGWAVGNLKSFAVALLIGLSLVLARFDYIVLLLVTSGVLLYLLVVAKRNGIGVLGALAGFMIGGLLGCAAIASFSYLVSGWPIPTSYYLKAVVTYRDGATDSVPLIEKMLQYFSWRREGIVLLSIVLLLFLPHTNRGRDRGRAWWFVFIDWASAYGLLTFHAAVNTKIEYWYYQPAIFMSTVFFFVLLGFLWNSIPRPLLVNRAGLSRGVLFCSLALFAFLVSVRRIQIRFGEYQTRIYDSRLELGTLLPQFIPGNALIFAEDHSGKLSFYSGLRIINGDGVVNSPSYIRDYLTKGRVYQYLQERNVRYYVVMLMPIGEYEAAKSRGSFADRVTSFTTVPSTILLRSDDCVLEYSYEVEQTWFAAVYALPIDLDSSPLLGWEAHSCVSLPMKPESNLLPLKLAKGSGQ